MWPTVSIYTTALEVVTLRLLSKCLYNQCHALHCPCLTFNITCSQSKQGVSADFVVQFPCPKGKAKPNLSDELEKQITLLASTAAQIDDTQQLEQKFASWIIEQRKAGVPGDLGLPVMFAGGSLQKVSTSSCLTNADDHCNIKHV